MGLSCLDDSSVKLVLDTSTAINLNATGCAALILGALPFETILTDIAYGELQEDSRNGRRDGELIEGLVSAGLCRIASINEADELLFGNLVIGPGTDTLDDGEASTIAHAVNQNAVAVLDERKARRICAERYVTLRIASTVDLLCHDSVANVLGRSSLADAVFATLMNARMRVLPGHWDWVVDLIGSERAKVCLSLPLHARNQIRSGIFSG
jgi:predicted nucleic acid-binding protein